jgi:hypothetical protein
MERVWPIIYAALGIGALIKGYLSLSPAQTQRTNADWLFVTITLILSTLSPLGMMAYSRARGNGTYRRPTFHRHPFGWWSDTLQPIRVSLIFAVLYCTGSAWALPHTDAQGKILFYWHLAIAVGMFLGERFVYRVFKERIV